MAIDMKTNFCYNISKENALKGVKIMVVVYLVLILILTAIISGIIKAVRKKNWLDLLILLLFFMFFFFAIANTVFGGSSFHDAATNYELYESGKYYLMSHGVYTEVSYSCFKFMQVVEIVGIASFALGFILAIFQKLRCV